MKKPERELIRSERKRSKRPLERTANRGSIGAFGILGRSLAIGGSGTLILLVIATFLTPLLAIEKIVVSGTERLQAGAISKSLEGLMARPLTTITEGEVTSLLAGFTLIETFAIQAVPPHTLQIKIRERQPVVVIASGGKNFLYDPAGVRIARVEKKDRYPFLLNPNLATDSPQFKTAIRVLLSLPVENYERVFSIQVSEALITTFTLRDSNIKVIWGGLNDALLKAEVMDSLLATKLKPGVQIDVTSPNAPVVTYQR